MAEELATRAKEAIYELVEEETGRKLGELTIVTEVFEVTPGVDQGEVHAPLGLQPHRCRPREEDKGGGGEGGRGEEGRSWNAAGTCRTSSSTV